MIELIGVGLRRGGAELLAGLFLAAEPGQVVLIAGPGGCGKSTLLDLIAGRVFADAGTVSVFGRDLRRLRSSSLALLRRRVALASQEILLLDDRSALANVAVALEVAGAPRDALRLRSAAALAEVGLAADVDRCVAALPTSARRRVCLARALVAEPDILLADDPTAGLDADTADRIAGVLERHRSGGGIALVASTDPRLLAGAERPGWRHLCLEEGHLVPGNLDTALDDLVGGELVPFPLPVRASASGGISS